MESKKVPDRDEGGIKTPPSISQIVDKIYTLESSNGKHDSCKSIGKFNGYGFMIHGNTYTCYDSYAEVRGEVEKWFTKHLKDMDLATATCYYNLGVKTNNCSYHDKFLSLN